MDEGAKINSFKSYTGGLIAPESDSNKWNYKFTWNPTGKVSKSVENIEAFSMIFDKDMTLKMGWGNTIISVTVE